jgi:1,4-dihydroxy-2-naphthoyl-CoA hydrolase
VKDINSPAGNTINVSLGIEITEISNDFVRGTMPADSRTFQPFGLIHGGANVVLAETLGSIGANFVIDQEKFYAVGQ